MSGDDATILVVDDVPENVRLLEAVLARRGYDVISATDGHGALELADSAKPDLVLLDVVMPQPDGYAVCRRLRESVKTAVLPVIMVTADAGPEKANAIDAGADDLIAKPFSHDELLARVRSLLRIKRYYGQDIQCRRRLRHSGGVISGGPGKHVSRSAGGHRARGVSVSSRALVEGKWGRSDRRLVCAMFGSAH
jgi:DNA-binding response OmpR family regulator